MFHQGLLNAGLRHSAFKRFLISVSRFHQGLLNAGLRLVLFVCMCGIIMFLLCFTKACLTRDCDTKAHDLSYYTSQLLFHQGLLNAGLRLSVPKYLFGSVSAGVSCFTKACLTRDCDLSARCTGTKPQFILVSLRPA